MGQDKVHGTVEKVLQSELDVHVPVKGGLFHLHEEIQVAILPVFSARGRAEKADPADPGTMEELTLFSEGVEDPRFLERHFLFLCVDGWIIALMGLLQATVV
jgi:hypothetical protein